MTQIKPILLRTATGLATAMILATGVSAQTTASADSTYQPAHLYSVAANLDGQSFGVDEQVVERGFGTRRFSRRRFSPRFFSRGKRR